MQNSASAARHLMPLSFVAVLKKRIVAHVCSHQTLKEGNHWHVLRQHHAHSWINSHAHSWINGVFTAYLGRRQGAAFTLLGSAPVSSPARATMSSEGTRL